MVPLWLAVLVVSLIAILVIQKRKDQNYWKERKVPHISSSIVEPLVDFYKQVSFVDKVSDVYAKFPNTRYTGFNFFGEPTLLIKDPDLIKQIGVKDFDHFVDHKQMVPKNVDPLWTRNLFVLEGQEWRDMRLILTPTFTSSKIKIMHELIHDITKQFTEHYLKTGLNKIPINFKDAFGRFTNDVIASTAFGVKIDSICDKDNEFFKMGKEALNLTGLTLILKMFVFKMAPKIAQIFNLTFFPKKMTAYFTNLIADTIKMRQDNNIVRPDMLNHLMEVRKNILKDSCLDAQPIDNGFGTIEESRTNTLIKKQKHMQLSDLDITAQAFVFFLGGFDTVSSLICFASYELAVNQDIQDKLRQEINETFEACDGNLTYDAVQKMRYMDMVINETLRKWPNQIVLSRTCTKDYTIEPQNADEVSLEIKKGQSTFIPVYAIHRDEKNYPEPEKFDPERFNDENKDQINPYTFLPFGVGPRSCIGNRLALLESKLLFCELLNRFRIVPTAESQVPIKLNKKGFSIAAEDGFQFGLEKLYGGCYIRNE